MRTAVLPESARKAVVRWAWRIGLVTLAAAVSAGEGYTGQAGGSGRPDLDPRKKGVWRFLDDSIETMLNDGGNAFRKGDYQTAARHYLAYLYRNGRDLRIVYALARCYSRMGDADAAVELLDRAAQGGFVHPELLQADKDMDPIRDTRAFRNHQKALTGLADRLGRTILVSGPRANLCRLRLPASHAPGKAYPLVVGLHGNGSNADNLMGAMTADAFSGMICVAPNGAYRRTDLSWLPGEWFSWYVQTDDRSVWSRFDPLTTDYILNVVDEVSRQYRVSHVVLLGFSQGVSAAYLTALRHPDRVAGVVAFAGGFPRDTFTPEEIKAASRLRIMIAHGTEDRAIGVQSSERARDLLREAGYRVHFEAFEGGHSLPPDVMRRAAEWIQSWQPDAPGKRLPGPRP